MLILHLEMPSLGTLAVAIAAGRRCQGVQRLLWLRALRIIMHSSYPSILFLTYVMSVLAGG